MINFITHNWVSVLWSAVILGGAILVAAVARAIVFWVLRRMAKRKGDLIFHSLVKHGARPSHWIFPFLACLIVVPGLPLPHIAVVALAHVTSIGLIASIAWLAILLVDVTADVITGRYRMDVSDNLTARRIQTQFGMLHKVVVFLVVVVALAIILMTFPTIRSIGGSLLASAGLASLIVGLAAKGTLSNLVAGIQIAFTQPFRIGDAVVIENEWGWIEEIGTMFVVVRIWDLRRLVLPLSYFMEHSFQNWTRTSADLLGHCFIYVDYTVPVDPLRDELRRICESSKLWGGKVCVLQVSDCEPTSLQLRALMDARNSGDAWDLRCLVREKMIDFIQKNYPGSLPRYRGEFKTSTPDSNGVVREQEHTLPSRASR
ncbi:MAG TPA: mechanosensitive ion channel domain-containing protein [Terracidiphilus sp.]|nr:mechanosensitive ion channel domain-containing protein [Terracidiphilus sp.]